MWYRGLTSGSGSSTARSSTRSKAKDAADVIERSAELIDAQGEDSAVATAREAQESGQNRPRMQPAIIRGERRMLRIVNVPLRDRRRRGLRGRRPGPRGRARRACTAIENCSASSPTE